MTLAGGTKGNLAPRVSPIDAALALGPAPDPRTDPQGYMNWYNSAKAAENNLMGTYQTPEQQASLANFFKQLDIGEGLMGNTSSYGYAQGANTSGSGALTNFINNYMPDTAENYTRPGYMPSHNWILDQALSGAPGYSFADGYIQRTAAPESLDRSEGLYDLLPGQEYRITDLDGNVIYTGTDASKIGNEFAPGLRDKGYSIQMSNPETGGWSVTHQYVPDPDPLGQFAMMAGPMLGAALFPMLAPAIGLGGLGGSATAALGAGLGSAAGGAAAGQSVGNILKNAALSAGLTYAGGELLGGVGNGSTPTTGAGGAAPIASNAGAGLGDIVVTGSRLAAPSFSMLPSFFDSANLSNDGGSSSGNSTATATATQPGDIVVTARPSVNPIGGVGNNLFNPYQSYNAESVQPRQTTTPTDSNEIVVEGQHEYPQFSADEIKALIAAGVTIPAAATAIGSGSSAAGATDAQISKNVDSSLKQLGVDTKAGMAAELGPTYGVGAAGAGMTLKDIGTYLRLAGYGGSLVNGLLGGGGSGSGSGSGAYYGGSGSGTLKPVFSASLPAANLPGASGSVAPRTDIGTVNGQPRDWTQYGFGPEQSFFDYVPQRGYAHGGNVSEDGGHSNFAVRGPGDGRSDDIPAVLSDGEYVMDAETVALLGNGSTKAGAEALDRFRVNLRKHKGKKLAKGKFSVDAKKPEQYLAGGRI